MPVQRQESITTISETPGRESVVVEVLSDEDIAHMFNRGIALTRNRLEQDQQQIPGTESPTIMHELNLLTAMGEFLSDPGSTPKLNDWGGSTDTGREGGVVFGSRPRADNYTTQYKFVSEAQDLNHLEGVQRTQSLKGVPADKVSAAELPILTVSLSAQRVYKEGGRVERPNSIGVSLSFARDGTCVEVSSVSYVGRTRYQNNELPLTDSDRAAMALFKNHIGILSKATDIAR